MATIAQPEPPSKGATIPYEKGLPILGSTLKMLSDQTEFAREMYAKHGPVYRTNAFFHEQVVLCGPAANEFFFMDREQCLSSKQGWAAFLEKFFPNSLMLMDFDQHRAHRKIMTAPFKVGAMKGYVPRLNTIVGRGVARMAEQGQFAFYPAIKQLTLDIAAEIFFGFEPGPQTRKANRALSNMVQASVAILRLPVPGTVYQAGLSGRKTMLRLLSEEVPKRRGGQGQDMFSILCNASDEDGNVFSDDEVVDHMIFLWMAAHDTITSSLTTLIYELARHREWQDKLAEEIAQQQLNSPDLPYEVLPKLVLTEAAFKEALRVRAPVPGIPRKTTQDTWFEGHFLPKGTNVSVSPNFAHHMDQVWPDSDRFDPERFLPGRDRDRPKFAWVPFGGGPHMCLGLHFAYMAAKIFLSHALSDHRFGVADGYRADFQILPIPKPKDGLPIHMIRYR